jgi:hypothetical protein
MGSFVPSYLPQLLLRHRNGSCKSPGHSRIRAFPRLGLFRGGQLASTLTLFALQSLNNDTGKAKPLFEFGFAARGGGECWVRQAHVPSCLAVVLLVIGTTKAKERE